MSFVLALLHGRDRFYQLIGQNVYGQLLEIISQQSDILKNLLNQVIRTVAKILLLIQIHCSTVCPKRKYCLNTHLYVIFLDKIFLLWFVVFILGKTQNGALLKTNNCKNRS